jgi:thioester reductase-like protein
MSLPHFLTGEECFQLYSKQCHLIGSKRLRDVRQLLWKSVQESNLKIVKTPIPSMNPEKTCIFLRVEGSLLASDPSRAVFHFARNSQAFSERIYRLFNVSIMALSRLFLNPFTRTFGLRLLHLPLRGVSRDRLDLLGEELFECSLRPQLNAEAINRVRQLQKGHSTLVLVSNELEHTIRPLAQMLDVGYLLTNRLEFRDGIATGRLQDPIIPAPGFFYQLKLEKNHGLFDPATLPWKVHRGLEHRTQKSFIFPAPRQGNEVAHPVVHFGNRTSRPQTLPIRQTLKGKKILLIGSTGFLGKVWLQMLLQDVPEIGQVFLLIRRHGSRNAMQRFEKMVAESPVFKPLHDRYGEALPTFLSQKVEILEGDVSDPQLGLDENISRSLQNNLDLIINSAGLTDFNPDLRLAVATNVDSILELTKFLRNCRQAALLHISTCFVNGRTEGRVAEEITHNYTPCGDQSFDALQELQFLHASIQEMTTESETHHMTASFRQEVISKPRPVGAASQSESSIQNQIRKMRTRWAREQLIELGKERAKKWGWPNIYTYTKSLGESLLLKEANGLPYSIVRPSIVESSVKQPFSGWNEGVNTTAPLSYMLGSYFRQLPSNHRKRLDIIPVDVVCRGMTLISAALILRRQQQVYQLATSANNPSDMRRTIELTCLAHRKHYRSIEGLEHWLRARFDTIPVSKKRYDRVSLPRWRAILEGVLRAISNLPVRADKLIRKQREYDRLQKIIELYEPFILDNEYYFAADHIKVLSAALPPEEVPLFGYDTESIDWYDYWINLHVPALRRWTYPLIEGRRPETGLLPRNFKMPQPASPVKPEEVKSIN